MAWYINTNGLLTTCPTLDTAPVTEILQLLALLMWTCFNLTTRHPPLPLFGPDPPILDPSINHFAFIHSFSLLHPSYANSPTIRTV
jgi:hypothetical protein